MGATFYVRLFETARCPLSVKTIAVIWLYVISKNMLCFADFPVTTLRP